MSDPTGARPHAFWPAVLWNERRPSAAKADGAISFCATVLPANEIDAGRKPTQMPGVSPHKRKVKAKDADD
jgi:hypothetical protein